MSGKSGISGSGSLMTEASYLKKMEQTVIFEDPNMLENYNRQTLKDIRPDAPFFESDQTRRDNRLSTDKLSLRHHGNRSNGVEAYLPDGTFLDFEGLTKDKRGLALDPNMNLHRKQQEARGKFIKQGIDDDNSVPSMGWHPTNVVKDIKGQFYNVKNRLKIFDESMSTINNSGVRKHASTTIDQCLQQTDERAPEMQDQMCYTRSNIINDLSNNTSIGWKRTTDHLFKVAKYGAMRGQASGKNQNFLKNRSNAQIDHDVLLSYQDQNTSKLLTIKMIDLAKQKANDMESGKGAMLGFSLSNAKRARKITNNDLTGFAHNNTDESMITSAHTMLNGEQVPHLSGGAVQPIVDNVMRKVVIDPFIIDYMASINRKMTTKEVKDLRDSVYRSAAFTGLLVSQTNAKCSNKNIVNNELLWQSTANFERGKSMKIANFNRLSGIKGAKDMNMLDFEEYKSKQKTSKQRRGKISAPTLYTMDATQYDNDAGIEYDRVKLVGKMGSKYTQAYHMTDTPDNDMEEVTARN